MTPDPQAKPGPADDIGTEMSEAELKNIYGADGLGGDTNPGGGMIDPGGPPPPPPPPGP